MLNSPWAVTGSICQVKFALSSKSARGGKAPLSILGPQWLRDWETLYKKQQSSGMNDPPAPDLSNAVR